MDNFDFDSLENYIKKYKRNIVNKLENIQLNEKSLRNQSDLLCLVLDYSPRIVEEKKMMEKIKIKNNNLIPELADRMISNRSLNLESKQNEGDEESEEESKDSKEGIIKLSRFSSKLSSIEQPSKMQDEMTINMIFKLFVNNLIENAMDCAENKKKENIKKTEQDEEDDYFKQIEQRRKKLEDEETRKPGSQRGYSLGTDKSYIMFENRRKR